MARDDEPFLARWSRRKVDAASAPASTSAQAAKPPAVAGEAAPPLPDPASLSFDSDFKAFMHAKVEESVKRAALKKLFADPHFNVMDGLDIYIDDYSQDVVMPEGMAATLEHSKNALFGPRPEPKTPAQAPASGAPDAVADEAAGAPLAASPDAPGLQHDRDARAAPEDEATRASAPDEQTRETDGKDVAAR